MRDYSKQDWRTREEREDVRAMQGILSGLVVALMFWGALLYGLLKAGAL